MKAGFLFLALGLIAAPAVAEERLPMETGQELAFVIKEYRYELAGTDSDADDAAHALCGSRCNALAFDYLDYLMAGSWDIRKIATNREISIPLDNPFKKGNCICTVDEFLVKANERNLPKPQ